MNKFWEFKNDVKSQGSDLYLEGEIASETWWGDEATPKAFREELGKCGGKVTVHLNSPGGDVFAGVSIYNALKDYAKKKKCEVIVKVDGLAASIASVVAMAGTEVVMSPGSMMMVHNPWSMGAGSAEELRKTADVLDEIKESIIPIYEDKTGMPYDKIVEIMDAETWMSAEKAVELGFADTVKVDKEEEEAPASMMRGNFAFNMSATRTAMADLIKKVNNERNTAVDPKEDEKIVEENATVVEEVEIEKVNEDGTAEAVVEGEEVTLTPADEETKEAIAEIAAEEAAEEVKAEEENAEEGEKEEEKAEEAADEGEAIADKIEAEIKALREENAELKAKLEEAEAKNAKASASINVQNRLQARYAAILNMAEEADGGEIASEKEDEKSVDTYGNALSDAFKNL